MATHTGLEIVPCPPAELGAALAVLYHRVPPFARTQLVTEARNEAARGALDLTGLWVGRRRGRIVGVILTQRLTSWTAALWAPEVTFGWGRAALAAGLIRTAVADLQAQGARIVQAVIEEDGPTRAAEDLTRGGLPRVTALTYLARDTFAPLAAPASTTPLVWRSFGPDTEAAFRAVLDATYMGSLDMPELEGVRSLDDVLATQRAAGRFEATHWQLGQVPGEPRTAALVLLADPPDRPAWEVSYLGLTPAARHRGLGRAALVHAMDLARPHTPRLELAVDIRNLPASRLYRAAGFVPFDRRAVHLAVFREGPALSRPSVPLSEQTSTRPPMPRSEAEHETGRDASSGEYP